MYVCICRAVKDSRIHLAIEAGASTVDEVEAACGAGGECGSCREQIGDMISAARGERCASCPNASRDIRTPHAA
jgi:bacterioferritin-associated ferredoxin